MSIPRPTSGTRKTTLDDFEELCVLGKGSFGVVSKVLRKQDEQFYVIKRILITELTYNQQIESINEVRLLAKMDSKFVVKYLDSFIHGKELCIVMEYCDKGDLRNLLKRAKAKNMSCIKEDVTWNIILQVILGLYYLHSQKVLHRDLKSANVFLKKPLESGPEAQKLFFDVKIGDLGVSKLLESSTAFAQTIVGTPYYLSPELCSDQPYRDRSDCWALGILVYECCTLRHPFEAKNQFALIMKIIKAQYDPLDEDIISIYMRNMLAWLLQKNPIHRPTMRALLCEKYVRVKLEENGLPLPDDLTNAIITDSLSDLSKLSWMRSAGAFRASSQISFKTPPIAEMKSTSSNHSSFNNSSIPSASVSPANTFNNHRRPSQKLLAPINDYKKETKDSDDIIVHHTSSASKPAVRKLTSSNREYHGESKGDIYGGDFHGSEGTLSNFNETVGQFSTTILSEEDSESDSESSDESVTNQSRDKYDIDSANRMEFKNELKESKEVTRTSVSVSVTELDLEKTVNRHSSQPDIKLSRKSSSQSSMALAMTSRIVLPEMTSQRFSTVDRESSSSRLNISNSRKSASNASMDASNHSDSDSYSGSPSSSIPKVILPQMVVSPHKVDNLSDQENSSGASPTAVTARVGASVLTQRMSSPRMSTQDVLHTNTPRSPISDNDSNYSQTHQSVRRASVSSPRSIDIIRVGSSHNISVPTSILYHNQDYPSSSDSDTRTTRISPRRTSISAISPLEVVSRTSSHDILRTNSSDLENNIMTSRTSIVSPRSLVATHTSSRNVLDNSTRRNSSHSIINNQIESNSPKTKMSKIVLPQMISSARLLDESPRGTSDIFRISTPREAEHDDKFEDCQSRTSPSSKVTYESIHVVETAVLESPRNVDNHMPNENGSRSPNTRRNSTPALSKKNSSYQSSESPREVSEQLDDSNITNHKPMFLSKTLPMSSLDIEVEDEEEEGDQHQPLVKRNSRESVKRNKVPIIANFDRVTGLSEQQILQDELNAAFKSPQPSSRLAATERISSSRPSSRLSTDRHADRPLSRPVSRLSTERHSDRPLSRPVSRLSTERNHDRPTSRSSGRRDNTYWESKECKSFIRRQDERDERDDQVRISEMKYTDFDYDDDYGDVAPDNDFDFDVNIRERSPSECSFDFDDADDDKATHDDFPLLHDDCKRYSNEFTRTSKTEKESYGHSGSSGSTNAFTKDSLDLTAKDSLDRTDRTAKDSLTSTQGTHTSNESDDELIRAEPKSPTRLNRCQTNTIMSYWRLDLQNDFKEKDKELSAFIHLYLSSNCTVDVDENFIQMEELIREKVLFELGMENFRNVYQALKGLVNSQELLEREVYLKADTKIFKELKLLLEEQTNANKIDDLGQSVNLIKLLLMLEHQRVYRNL